VATSSTNFLLFSGGLAVAFKAAWSFITRYCCIGGKRLQFSYMLILLDNSSKFNWGKSRCGDRLASAVIATPGYVTGDNEELDVRCTGLRIGIVLVACGLSACQPGPTLPPAPIESALPSAQYVIGPGDGIGIFVWRNPELSTEVPVRPDGRISIPLVEDVTAVGKTPTLLARELEARLSKYVTNPLVTVIPRSFVGPFAQQVRVIGEAATPRALPYRANMTVLDAMIEVGGLTKYAAGDRATLVRTVNDVQESYQLHLNRLINHGDIQDNVSLAPGDILIIPQTYF
jgi:polysaccharide biosynthesis/export protein